MKILGQIVAIEPLALIVSLPNQLFAHVPITQISTQLTHILETMDDVEMQSSDDEEEEASPSRVPDLFEIFRPGQYVRAVVTAVNPPGATDATGLGRARDEVQKASRRVELSLVPEKVNENIAKADLRPGFVSTTRSSGVTTPKKITGYVSISQERRGSWIYPRIGHTGGLWIPVVQGRPEGSL